MRCPTVARLLATFRDLDRQRATLIRKLAASVDDADALRAIVDASCPDTAAYVRRMYSDPYGSGMWRRTVMLHAIDRALGTHGVEPLGEVRREGAPYEYCNTGDTYAATIVYVRASDMLTIDSWGDIEQRNERRAPRGRAFDETSHYRCQS